jgi:hypothetical protein
VINPQPGPPTLERKKGMMMGNHLGQVSLLRECLGRILRGAAASLFQRPRPVCMAFKTADKRVKQTRHTGASTGGRDSDREKRGHPRSPMHLPLEYRVINAPFSHGGIVANGSEDGLLIHSVKDMPLGTKLDIVVIFPDEFELSNFELMAEIIRRDRHQEEDWEGYAYGLKFLQIFEEDREKLRELLKALHVNREDLVGSL